MLGHLPREARKCNVESWRGLWQNEFGEWMSRYRGLEAELPRTQPCPCGRFPLRRRVSYVNPPQRLMDDKVLRIRLGQNARREVRARYDPEPILEKLLELYLTLAQVPDARNLHRT